MSGTRLYVAARRARAVAIVARHALGASEADLVSELQKIFHRRPEFCRWVLRDLLVEGLIDIDPDIWRMKKQRFYRAAAAAGQRRSATT